MPLERPPMSSDSSGSVPDTSSRSVSSLRLSLPPIPDSYFGDDLYDSPDSNSTEDTLSDSTFDDAERLDFGYPLERMPRRASSSQVYDLDEQITALLKVSPSKPSHSGSSASLFCSASYDSIDYNEVTEDMLHQTPSPFLFDSRNMVAFNPTSSSKFSSISAFGPRLMIKALPRSSPELLLLLELNHPDLRGDPRNSLPHIISAVERVDKVYLYMQGLSEYNQPPLLDVAQYIDFFRQILEGVTFLHEQRVAGLSCLDPSSLMVDLSSAPRIPSSTQAQANSSEIFDRFTYPVRYYFVNYSAACRTPAESTSNGSSLKGEPTLDSPFQKDVRDCGALLERLLLDVPQISQKFKSLTRGMVQGNFTADNSRRLFEALCHSLDATVVESRVPPRHPRMPERAHTLSHSIPSRPLSSKFLQLEKVSSH